MKEKIKKIKISKSQIITIVLAAIVAVIFSFGTSYAATTIFSSSNVGFDNTGTKIQATTVQGAIDELYEAATDYSSMNTRVNGVEETIGDSTLTTNSQTLTGGINELNGKIVSYPDYSKKIVIASNSSFEYTPTKNGWISVLASSTQLTQVIITINGDTNWYASIMNSSFFPVVAGNTYKSQNSVRQAMFIEGI